MYKNDIKTIDVGGDDIDVIPVNVFLASLKKLEINNFSDMDIKCLLKVFTTSDLPEKIKIENLKSLLSNFGVNEYEQPIENQTNFDGMTDTDDPRRKKRKNLNYDLLTKESLNVLAVFTDFLLDTDTSVYEFFDGMIYNQVVRTKNKQSTVEIMASNEFFNKIRENDELMQVINEEYLNETTEGEYLPNLNS